MTKTTTATVKDFIKGENMMPKSSRSSKKKKATPYILGYRKGYNKGFEEGREFAVKLLVDLHVNTIREQRRQNASSITTQNTQQTVRKEKPEA